jgi:hypothetical protein
MRVSSFAVARPAYYDRNATGSYLTYGAQNTPHALTTRWTTTVATGKKGVIEYARGFTERRVVGGSAGQYSSWVQITSGATTGTLIFANSFNNTLYNQVHIEIASAITLYAGDVFFYQTYDDSASGTIYYQGDAKVTLFDA